MHDIRKVEKAMTKNVVLIRLSYKLRNAETSSTGD